MFTTAHHFYLYLACGIYAFAWLLTFTKMMRMGHALLLAGLVVHGAYLMGRGWLGGVFIANPIVEGPFFLPFCMALICWGMGAKSISGRWKILLPLVLCFMAFSMGYAKGMIPPTPKKISVWAVLFFISESSAHACFYISAVLAGFAWTKKEYEPIFRTFVIWGVVAYTVSQVTGAVWSFWGWGNTFNWSPRHLSSAGIWMMYLAILHVKFIPGWGIKRESLLTAFAGLLVLFTTFGHYLKEMTFPRIGG